MIRNPSAPRCSAPDLFTFRRSGCKNQHHNYVIGEPKSINIRIVGDLHGDSLALSRNGHGHIQEWKYDARNGHPKRWCRYILNLYAYSRHPFNNRILWRQFDL